MNSDELTAIRQRAEKATPGEWYTVGLPWNHEPFTWVIAGSEDPHQGKPVCDCIYIDSWEGDAEAPDYSQSCIDMDFIAHARTDIPKLLDYIELLEKAITNLNKFAYKVDEDALQISPDEYKQAWMRAAAYELEKENK